MNVGLGRGVSAGLDTARLVLKRAMGHPHRDPALTGELHSVAREVEEGLARAWAREVRHVAQADTIGLRSPRAFP